MLSTKKRPSVPFLCFSFNVKLPSSPDASNIHESRIHANCLQLILAASKSSSVVCQSCLRHLLLDLIPPASLSNKGGWLVGWLEISDLKSEPCGCSPRLSEVDNTASLKVEQRMAWKVFSPNTLDYCYPLAMETVCCYQLAVKKF